LLVQLLPRRLAHRLPLGLLAAATALLVAAPGTLAQAVPVELSASAPSAGDVAAQQQEAQRLAQETTAQERAVAAAQAALVALADQAGAALEAREEALRERDAAQAEEQAQVERLVAAQALVGAKRGEMGRWASRTYRAGGVLADYESLMTVLEAESTDDLSQRLAMLQRVGRMRGDVVHTVTEAEAVQADATRKAEQAALTASLAAERAETAKADADRLVAEQAAQLSVLQGLLATTSTAAAVADEQARQLAQARAIAEQRRLSAAAGHGSNAVVGPVGSCAGGDVSRYPNGSIPVSALCPLWGAPGHHLRADAAHAFNQLSEAYAAEHGQPLCVTDSYRTLESQIAVRAAKPGLAAVPGTSNHGWGTAVDLCGGVQQFGTPAHQWMRAHAPLYGFFHPRWAQASGSKPEPWHWEYGA
jgi:D-alanyl-D-alanine carboxypeptidase